LEAFFLGDSLVFLGDFDDLAFFGDSLFFFGDLVVLALAALAFFGEVASFLGLDEDTFFGEDVEGFLVAVFLVADFLVDLAFVVVVFFGELTALDDFLELDVDLFLGDVEAVVDEVPEVDEVDDVTVDFLVDDFFLSFILDPGASLYDALTLTNKTPSLRFKANLTCLLTSSASSL